MCASVMQLPILCCVAKPPMDGDIETCGEGREVALAGWAPHSIGNGRMGVHELGITPIRIWMICAMSWGGAIATSWGGRNKSPKDGLGVMVPSLNLGHGGGGSRENGAQRKVWEPGEVGRCIR
jgi:hypothetical protein